MRKNCILTFKYVALWIRAVWAKDLLAAAVARWLTIKKAFLDLDKLHPICIIIENNIHFVILSANEYHLRITTILWSPPKFRSPVFF